MPVRTYYFLRENGRSPLEDYIESISDMRQQAAILAVIQKLISYEGRLPRPHAAHIEGKIWELRTRLGNRVFYFIQEGKEIILLDGYTKKQDRIEPRMKQKMIGLYEEYLITHKRKAW